KHHAPRDAEFAWAIEPTRGNRGHGGMRPWEELSAEAGTKKSCDDADVLDWKPQHLRHDNAMIHDALSGFVKCHAVAIPHGDGRMQFDGVVRLNGRSEDGVDLHRRGCERRIRIAALRDGFARTGVVTQLHIDIGRFRFVLHMYG